MRFQYCVALGLFSLSVTGPAKADFKDALANRLSANADYLVVNLPPRPDAWPGAIFTSNMRIPIKHGDPNDPALRRGDAVKIDAKEGLDASAGAKGGYSGWMGVSASATDIANVSIALPDATVVDMDLGDLIKRVQDSNEAVAAAKRGKPP